MFNLSSALSLTMGSIKEYIKQAKASCSIIKGKCTNNAGVLYEWYLYPDGRMQIVYSCGDAHYNYIINIAAQPSNLGLGDCYYFVCPEKGVLCRKLYFYKGMFVSRQAIPKAVYDSQMDKSGGGFKMLLSILDVMQPNRKEYYKGRITPYGKKMQKCYNMLRAFNYSS